MRLLLKIKFNKKIDPAEGFPSVGGFEVQTDDKKIYQFDYLDVEGYVSPEDNYACEYLLKNPDYSSFPEMKKLEEKIENIVKINECYIDLESYDNPDIAPQPLFIEDFCFLSDSFDIMPTILSKEIISDYKF